LVCPSSVGWEASGGIQPHTGSDCPLESINSQGGLNHPIYSIASHVTAPRTRSTTSPLRYHCSRPRSTSSSGGRRGDSDLTIHSFVILGLGFFVRRKSEERYSLLTLQ